MDDYGNSIMEWYPHMVKHFILCSDEEFDAIHNYSDFYLGDW